VKQRVPGIIMRPGFALLHRIADRNEALAGDLLEGYAQRQSALWFWRELLGAMLSGAFRSTGEIRPIKLVQFPSWQQPREDFEKTRRMLATVGLSASPVDGIGGMSIAIAIAAISLLQPMLWVILLFGIILGSVAGLLRALSGKWQRKQSPKGVVLFSHHG